MVLGNAGKYIEKCIGKYTAARARQRTYPEENQNAPGAWEDTRNVFAPSECVRDLRGVLCGYLSRAPGAFWFSSGHFLCLARAAVYFPVYFSVYFPAMPKSYFASFFVYSEFVPASPGCARSSASQGLVLPSRPHPFPHLGSCVM